MHLKDPSSIIWLNLGPYIKCIHHRLPETLTTSIQSMLDIFHVLIEGLELNSQ